VSKEKCRQPDLVISTFRSGCPDAVYDCQLAGDCIGKVACLIVSQGLPALLFNLAAVRQF
jgi:hypothetical protein